MTRPRSARTSSPGAPLTASPRSPRTRASTPACDPDAGHSALSSGPGCWSRPGCGSHSGDILSRYHSAMRLEGWGERSSVRNNSLINKLFVFSHPLAATWCSRCDTPDHTADSRASSPGRRPSDSPGTVCSPRTATNTGTPAWPSPRTFLCNLDGLERKRKVLK